jgi:hypothetical protein
MIEPGGEGVTVIANAEESRSYGTARLLFLNDVSGGTSTVAITSDLYQVDTSPATLQRAGTSPLSSRRIEEHSGIEALLNPATTSTGDYTLRKPATPNLDDITNKVIADRHLANYFTTIHTFIPVLHEGSFRALYNGLWSGLDFESTDQQREPNLRKITAPLIYSVLALGALYEDGFNDHAFWAKEWFTKAREGTLNVAEDCCFEVCLTFFFLVRKYVFCKLMGRHHTHDSCSTQI